MSWLTSSVCSLAELNIWTILLFDVFNFGFSNVLSPWPTACSMITDLTWLFVSGERAKVLIIFADGVQVVQDSQTSANLIQRCARLYCLPNFEILEGAVSSSSSITSSSSATTSSSMSSEGYKHTHPISMASLLCIQYKKVRRASKQTHSPVSLHGSN